LPDPDAGVTAADPFTIEQVNLAIALQRFFGYNRVGKDEEGRASPSSRGWPVGERIAVHVGRELMPGQTLEQRVAQLEQQMNKVLGERDHGDGPERDDTVRSVLVTAREPGPDDWQSTVGAFRGDPIFQEMMAETTRRRNEERRQAREESERESA
jgi:hypothetical protein